MDMGRRDFLTLSAMLAAGFVFKKGHAQSPSKFLCQPYENLVQNDYGIFFLDFSSRRLESIKTPFSIHMLEVSNKAPGTALGVNKYGPNFVRVDLAKKKIIESHEIKNSLILTGHMSFSLNDEFLCATATDSSKKGQDCIAILNSSSFKLEDIVYLPHSSPSHHDCKFLHGTGILATTASQSIDFVDVSRKKVVQNHFDFAGEASQLRHFSINKDGHFVGQGNKMEVSGSDLSYSKAKIVFMEKSKKTVIDLEKIEKSVAHAELQDFSFNRNGNLFAAVHGGTHKVSFWNFEQKKMLKLMDHHRASRVAFDENKNEFVIISAYEIAHVNAETLKVREKYFTGMPPVKTALGHKTLV